MIYFLNIDVMIYYMIFLKKILTKRHKIYNMSHEIMITL